MRIDRTRNALRNMVWGVVSKITTLLLPFIVRTVLIKTLGAEYLGISGLFTSILSVLSLAELGFGSAIVFSMYEPIAKNDNYTLCALLNVYKKIYRVIGILILVIGIIVLPFVKYLINGTYPRDVNLQLLFAIYLLNTVLSYFLYAYKGALFTAFQRNDIVSKIAASLAIIDNLLKIVFIYTTRNYYVYVLVIPVITLTTNIVISILADRMFPEIICSGSISSEMSKGIRKQITGLVAFKIYGVVFMSVDTLVISSFLGLVPLAIYNNYYYIQYSIIGFMGILTSSITAGIGNKMITNSIDDNYEDFNKIVFMNAWISGWCAVCLVCLYQPFMKLWVGANLSFPVETMLLMVAYFYLPRVSSITATYREAAGLWWEDRYRPLIATLANLVINLVLVQLIGMNGIIISTLICTILINIPWGSYILFKNYFRRSGLHYYLRLFVHTGITVLVCTITYSITSLISDQGVLPLMLKVVICVIVPNILFLMAFRALPEYKGTVQFVSRALRKRFV